MDRPIAIGVMAFNEEGNIARLLDSILNQTAFDKINRVLVIASGCTDQTCAIVDRYAAEHPKIQLVAEFIPSKAMQSWSARSAGFFGVPRAAK